MPGRLEPWQRAALADPAALRTLVSRHGSPVNLVEPSPLSRHAADLVAAARDSGIDLRIFFARKANKALAVVDAALASGHGVDVASERELDQVMSRGADPDRVVLTAAVKPESLLRSAVGHGVIVSVDNRDELAALDRVADRPVRVALRLAPSLVDAPPTRFGLTGDAWESVLAGLPDRLRFVGVHFHLHGYDPYQRADALHQALDLIERSRSLGHHPEFVDIGGGIPMRYLDTPEPWDEYRRDTTDDDHRFWEGVRPSAVYPVWQEPIRGDWLRALFAHRAVGDRVGHVGVRIHLEPGRALLDGCGVTVARVEFRKQRADGTWLVGVAMNRTQVRSAADDFLVDPILVPAPVGQDRTPPIDGFLVGAYCIEAELLTRRRMTFPDGVAVGDLIVFVNTAGYLMHILESASHQIPLAHNLVRDAQENEWVPDAIDGVDGARPDLAIGPGAR